jgi:hypothetical protein
MAHVALNKQSNAMWEEAIDGQALALQRQPHHSLLPRAPQGVDSCGVHHVCAGCVMMS